MNIENKIILVLIYLIMLIISTLCLYLSFKKLKKIRIIDFFNIYYIIVYFLVPIFYLHSSSLKFNIKYSIFLSYGFKYHLLSCFMSIIFYVLINLFYKYIKVNIHSKKEEEIVINDKIFFSLNFLFSVIGIFSFYMWSKVYGFPFGIIKYADLLRDNKVIIDNPFTFFQPFCNFALYASYLWLILIKQYKKRTNKILAFLLFLITFFFSVLSTLATDSRMSIITLFLVPIIYFLNSNKLSLKKIWVIGIFSIIMLGNMNSITYFIRNGEINENYVNENNIFFLLSYEFGFTYSNRINLLYNIEHREVKITAPNDLANILLSWVPKSMKPTGLNTLGRYNTTLYTYASGTIPTDIVTASIYKARIIGLILLPLFVGSIIKLLDAFFAHKKSPFYKIIFAIICVIIDLRLVAYYDLSELLFSRFALIIYYFSLIILCKRRNINENV